MRMRLVNLPDRKPRTLDDAVSIVTEAIQPHLRVFMLRPGSSGVVELARQLFTEWLLGLKDSDLAKHFKKVYGIGHEYDMIAIVISAVEAQERGVYFDATAEAGRYKHFHQTLGCDPLTMERVSDRQ